MDEKIDENILRWFGYIERMRNERITEGVNAREYLNNRLVG